MRVILIILFGIMSFSSWSINAAHPRGKVKLADLKTKPITLDEVMKSNEDEFINRQEKFKKDRTPASIHIDPGHPNRPNKREIGFEN